MNGVLLFHGLSSTPAELKNISSQMSKKGYIVSNVEIDGYTHNTGISDEHYWINKALDEYDALYKKCKNIVVIGLCIGALLALNVAAHRKVKAVILLSSTLKYDGWAVPKSAKLLYILKYIKYFHKFSIKESYPYGVKNDRIRMVVANQMTKTGVSVVGGERLTIGNLVKGLNLAKITIPKLSRINCPALLIHSNLDESSSIDNTHKISKLLGSRILRIIVLNNSYHMITIDQERKTVLVEIEKFLFDYLHL